MGRMARLTWWATTMAAGAATLIGIVVLFGYSLSEVLAHPGFSLEDGYWVGRLPWISIGVDVTVIGATAMVVFGTVSTFFGRTRLGLVSLIPFGIACFFWFVALYDHPTGAPCVSCPTQTPDPFAYAYSSPSTTVILLLLPALVVAGLAFATRPRNGKPSVTLEG